VNQAALQDAMNICEQVLSQNPQSPLATSLKQRILALLSGNDSQPGEIQTFENKWNIDDASAQRMDALIAQSEERFALLGNTIRENSCNKARLPPQLFLPFDYVQRNSEFRYKNGLALRVRIASGAPSWITMNPGDFAYDLHPALVLGVADTGTPVLAGFNPTARQLQLSPNYDPRRHLDCFLKYHEIWHAAQDDWLRQHIDPHSYDSLNQEGKNLIMDFEFEAYAMMLEAMDCFLEGELRRHTQAPLTPEDTQWLHAELRGQNGTEMSSTWLLTIARRLLNVPGYSPGSDDYPEDFKQYLIRNHQHNRCLWTLDRATGRLEKLNHV
jgi:hypothetical protein